MQYNFIMFQVRSITGNRVFILSAKTTKVLFLLLNQLLLYMSVINIYYGNKKRPSFDCKREGRGFDFRLEETADFRLKISVLQGQAGKLFHERLMLPSHGLRRSSGSTMRHFWVFMYVCMYISMNVCIFVSIYVYMYICRSTRST